jgi:hypothetical protein
MSTQRRQMAFGSVAVSLLMVAMAILGCKAVQLGSAASGQVEGSVSQEKQDVKITGSVTLSTTMASATVFTSTTKLDAQNHFAFTNVKPDKYVLRIVVNENPCFLGAPGTVFNGMSIFWQEGWSGIGLSFKDGSSAIIGTSEVFTVTAGATIKQTFALPRCYSR